MSELINNINDIIKLEYNVKAFSLLEKDNKLDILEKVKEIRTDIIGQFLHDAYALENDKQVQKVIKKLLFRLKTVGIRVEELKVEGEPVLRKIEEKREHRGLISNYDAGGTRMTMVAFEAKKNTYVLVHGLLHFSKGLLELANAPVDGEDLKQIISGYLKNSMKPFTVVEVAPRYASYLIEEASSLSGRYVEEVKQMRVFSARLGGQVQKPLDIYNLEIPNDTEALPTERILSNELFEAFSNAWDTLEDDKKRFDEIGDSSTIVLPPYMVEEKKQAFLKGLMENSNLKSDLPLMKRLMEDYAYIFHCLGEFNAYKGLMEMLKETDVPEKTLSFFVKKVLEQKKEQQPGLIVNPYEQVRTPR
jgi:hypothetical protein